MNIGFSAYYNGGADKPTPLDQVPDCIDTVPLAFAGLTPRSTMTTEYLYSKTSKEVLMEQVRTLQGRGKKVHLSLIDSQTVRWNQIDFDTYITSVVQKALGEWKVDGFDIDGESTVINLMSTFVPKLRQAIGSTIPITYTCYTCSQEDADILNAIKPCINYVQTMSYGCDPVTMFKVAGYYANIVGKENVRVGVAVNITDLSYCTTIAQGVVQNGYVGMMLWSVESDKPSFSGKPLWSWVNAVEAGLKSQSSHDFV